MIRMIGAIVVAAACVIVPAHTAQAQAVPEPDRSFMIEAARSGIAEVEMGRMASQRAATESVRQFGQRIATDHGAANQELVQLAQARGVMLPQEMDAAHRATLDRLMMLSGPAFEQAFMTEMMRDHQNDAALFMRETRSGQDAQVRAWAMKVLPTIQEHQRLAYDIHSRIAGMPAPPAVVVAPPAAVSASPTTVIVAPPAAVAASPATVTTITTTTVPLPPFCGGAYLPGVGTNFGGCSR